MSNVIAFNTARSQVYKRRCNTAYTGYALEVVLIVDDTETRDLIRRCLGYGAI